MEAVVALVYALIGLVCSLVVLLIAIVVAMVYVYRSKISSITIDIEREWRGKNART